MPDSRDADADWLLALERDAAGWSALIAQGRPLTSRRVCLRLDRFARAAAVLSRLAARKPAMRGCCEAIDAWLFGHLLPYCVAHFEAIDDGEFDLTRHFASATAVLCATGYAPAGAAPLRRAFACLIKNCLRGAPVSPRAVAAVLDALRIGLARNAIGASTPGLVEAYGRLAERIAAGQLRCIDRQARRHAVEGLHVGIERGLVRMTAMN